MDGPGPERLIRSDCIYARMTSIKPGLERQLRRQALWLKDSWLWLLERNVLAEGTCEARLKALDVGCGPGLVMEVLAPLFDTKGIDLEPEMVSEARRKGLDVDVADAYSLPFDDGSFDLVYCSFLLLWVKDPVRVLSEMKRVSRDWVVCLAEPDFGGRIDYPDGLEGLSELIEDGIRRDGGDPVMGRKLRSVFSTCGLKAEVGVHAGVWDVERLRAESVDEWRWLEMTMPPDTDKTALDSLRKTWSDAVANGTLFQFNPIFYAFARKTA